jgi:small subunit ribosomal protein S14
MAKKSLKQREEQAREAGAKYAKKYAELKAVIANDAKKSDEERYAARLELQKLPRNANPTRLRNRCELTGRPAAPSACSAWAATRSANSPSRATSPGMVKASW